MKMIEMDLIEDQLFIFSDVSGYMTPIEDVDTVRTGAGGTHEHMVTWTHGHDDNFNVSSNCSIL